MRHSIQGFSSNIALPDLSKLEPLDGSNYRRWSQKLLILFEQLEVDYVLFHDVPYEKSENSQPPIAPLTTSITKKTNEEYDESKKRFDKDNKTVRGHLLNHVTNSLFDLFLIQKQAKAIWNTSENRYGGDDAGRKKYVVRKWLQFKMVDDKPMMDQVHEYKNLVANVLCEGMKMCEMLQANVLLEKFPPSWSDYRNQLKHKKKDLTLQELISHMRIEEANQLKAKQSFVSFISVKANLVESVGASKDGFKGKCKKFQKDGHQKKANQIKKGDGKIHKKTVACYVCGKPCHKAY